MEFYVFKIELMATVFAATNALRTDERRRIFAVFTYNYYPSTALRSEMPCLECGI